LKDVIKRSGREVIWYGRGGESRYKPLEFKNGVFLFDTPEGKIVLKNKYLIGMHNASNLSGLLACADVLGLDLKKVVSVMERFEGVRRRQEFVGEVRGIKIYDDFAHHPTAVAETIKAFRVTYPGSRIVCVFEPRTNSSRRRVFEKDYISAFGHADIVFLLPVYGSLNTKKDEVLSENFIITSIKNKGKIAEILNGYNDIFKIKARLREKDVVVFMSSGDMNGMPYSLLNALQNDNF
jgi:UDP-N-acetylmuramate: L-alanyl-gamma-D-glutamyl-meso-diaminopimelate ligase